MKLNQCLTLDPSGNPVTETVIAVTDSSGNVVTDANGNPVTQAIVSVTDASGNVVTGIIFMLHSGKNIWKAFLEL